MLPKIERILAGEEDKRDVQRTIFHEMRDGKLSDEEKMPMRLMGESHVFLGAGTETTARTLAVTTYYLMKKSDVDDRLREELKTVLPHPDSEVSLAQLEALPYLVRWEYSHPSPRPYLRNAVRSHQRRPARRSRRLFTPASYRNKRKSRLQEMGHSTQNTGHAIREPLTYGF